MHRFDVRIGDGVPPVQVPPVHAHQLKKRAASPVSRFTRQENRNVVSIPSTQMTDREIQLALRRIASEIVENCGAGTRLALVGIRTRGEPLARRIAGIIQEIEGIEVPVGVLDIGIHRDDIGHPGDPRSFGPTAIDFDIQDRHMVLVDDVFFTGRTIRAALDALMEMGRPRRVWLAVLIDRGHRELPFQPDFVGKNLPTAREERINVHLEEIDGEDAVTLVQTA